MKLTPAMKIILAVAAICIAVTLITTNNIATVMVLYGLNTTPAVATIPKIVFNGEFDKLYSSNCSNFYIYIIFREYAFFLNLMLFSHRPSVLKQTIPKTHFPILLP